MIGPTDEYQNMIEDFLATNHVEFMRDLLWLIAFAPVLIVLTWCATLISIGLSVP